MRHRFHVDRQGEKFKMKFQKVTGMTFLAVILIAGVLLYFAHADDDGVYCHNYERVTDTEVVAKNDVRLNVRTPEGYYTGHGNCQVWIDNKPLEDRGPIWVRVYFSGEERRYTVRERSARLSGSARVTKGAIASGYI